MTIRDKTNKFISDEGTCILENTVVEHFGCGIKCAKGGKLVLKQSTISNAEIGLEVSDGSNVEAQLTQIRDCVEHGISYSTTNEGLFLKDEKKKILPYLSQFQALMS